LGGSSGLVGAALLSACTGGRTPGVAASPSPGMVAPPADEKTVRLSTVVTVRDGGLYDVLLPDFQAQTGYTVRVLAGEDVYGPARAGEADIVLSHYGHKDVDTFVQGGFGAWPRTILFNQVCLIGPIADPARVAGLADLVTAFHRIAAVTAPFIVNNSEGLQYLSQTIAIDAGLAPTGGLFVDERLKEGAAMQAAAARGGYTVWGLTPFLRYLKDSPLLLRPLVLADPILQRIMVTTVVNPAKVKGVNARGAAAFQDYLLAPATQAKIRAFRLPGIDQPVFWPAGRNNAAAFLPDLTGSTPAQSSGAPARGAGSGDQGAGGGTGTPSSRP